MDELPRRYAGVDVPHWEQYTGWWAIHPLRFQQFAAFCGGLNPQAHLSAGRIARRGEEEDAAPYTVHDGVALLEIVGPMTKYGSSFAPLGAMLQTRRNLRAALADPKVRAAVLRIDSPGGTTTGTDDLAAEVLTANQKKPIVAYGEDLMASAAYYVASQAEEIVATKATEIGSIGVFTVVDDWSGFYAQKGIKTHVIATGKFKGAGVAGTAITEEQLNEWQRMVDGFMELFVGAIALGRRMETQKVRELGDGRMWLAAEAKRLGLIERLGSLETAMNRARALAGDREETKSTVHRTAAHGIGPMEQTQYADADEGSAALMETENEEMNMNTEKTAGAAPPAAGDGARKNTADTAVAHGPPTGGRLEQIAASLAELKASFPEAPAEFQLECLEQERTMTQATTAWMGRLRDKVKAQDAALKEAADKNKLIKPPGNAPVASGGSTNGPPGEQEMIAQAVAAAGGNYRKGLETLQRKLLKPHLDAGLSGKAAHARAAWEFPAVFGEAA